MTDEAPVGDTDDLPVIDAFLDLVSEVDLAKIVHYELRGRRRDGGFDDLDDNPELENEVDGDIESKAIVAEAPGFVSTEPWQVDVLTRQTADQLAVRVVSVTNSPQLEIVVDLAAIYRKRHPFIVSEGAFTEFVEKVALMGLFPFLREAVQTQSTRLGAQITLGLLRADSIGQGPSPSPK